MIVALEDDITIGLDANNKLRPLKGGEIALNVHSESFRFQKWNFLTLRGHWWHLRGHHFCFRAMVLGSMLLTFRVNNLAENSI